MARSKEEDESAAGSRRKKRAAGEGSSRAPRPSAHSARPSTGTNSHDARSWDARGRNAGDREPASGEESGGEVAAGGGDGRVDWVGRGAQLRPLNRFRDYHVEEEPHEWDAQEEDAGQAGAEGGNRAGRLRTEYLPDAAESIVSENDSPDVNFRYSINPYRGCSHGCSYCYARPTHEYLGFDAGLDFESRILVKHRAPELFRAWLSRDAWVPEPITVSGITDCYQPAEREFRLTRGLLEVAWEARQPMSIITKNALVARDGDLLQAMAARGLVSVAISINSLDQSLVRDLEPRTSSPAARLRAMRQLADWGVPTQVVVAPVIPGLNDHEIAGILRAARDHGARRASYVMLRLPGSVEPVFLDWLGRRRPLQAAKVEAAIRSVRGGKLNSSQFGERKRGTGVRAEQIAATFRVFAQQAGFSEPPFEYNTGDFQPPQPRSGQLRLF